MNALMNVAYKRARLMLLPQSVLRVCLLLACLPLAACGNKGDLYLEQVQLTEEQKNLLNELNNSDGEESSLENDKNKKKKNPAQTEVVK